MVLFSLDPRGVELRQRICSLANGDSNAQLGLQILGVSHDLPGNKLGILRLAQRANDGRGLSVASILQGPNDALQSVVRTALLEYGGSLSFDCETVKTAASTVYV